MTFTARYNSVFKDVNECTKRYRALVGSAGSGKSANVATDFIRKLSDSQYLGANLLVVRKTEEANRDSTFAELCAAIRRLFGEGAGALWHARHTPLSLTCLATGNRILFRGVSDARQRERIKSIALPSGKLTWIWCEEATELLREDVDMLDDRLRGALPSGLYYQLTLTFNPVSSAHWLKAAFFDRDDPDVLAHHSTYLDNAFIDTHFHRRMQRRKLTDPDGYRVYALGEWGQADGLILPNFKIHKVSRNPLDYDAVALGADFGYNHAWATLLLGFKDGDVFVLDEVYRRETDTEAMCSLLHFDKRAAMWCDSAEPDRISALRRHGFNARPVKKRPGSVKAQIDWLKGRFIHIHPDCVNTAREIAAWRWRKDPCSGLYLDEPAPGEDDAMAALRYGVEGWRGSASWRFVRLGGQE